MRLVVASFTILFAANSSQAIIRYVDADAAPNGDGLSWATAFDNLNAALDLASSGDEIRVAGGVYAPDTGPGRTPGDRNASFEISAGIAVRGGFSGQGAADPDARDFSLNETILSGDLLGDDGANFGNYQDNSLHVLMTAAPSANNVTIEGFTVTGGNADDEGPSEFSGKGGGMILRGFQVNVDYCRIVANSARLEGGGVLGGNAFNHCAFLDNRVTDSADNLAGGNPSGGGALSAQLPSWALYNCTLAGNTSDSIGGAIHYFYGSLFLVNCVVVDNFAPQLGGGIRAWGAVGAFELTNSIIWGNHTDAGNEPDDQISTRVGGASNCIIEGFAGTVPGLFFVTEVTGDDPLFVDAAAGDFHVDSASPCVDAGDSLFATVYGDGLDVDGDLRIAGCDADIGIDEQFGGAPQSGDLTGDGVINSADIAPFVDALLVTPSESVSCVGDLNADGAFNGLDILELVLQLT